MSLLFSRLKLRISYLHCVIFYLVGLLPDKYNIHFCCTMQPQWRTEGGRLKPFPTPKFQSFDKADPNSQFRGKWMRNNLIRIQVSLICKLSGIPWLGVYRTQIAILSILNWSCWTLPPPQKKKETWVRHCAACNLQNYNIGCRTYSVHVQKRSNLIPQLLVLSIYMVKIC
jgi:hypothetical protein